MSEPAAPPTSDPAPRPAAQGKKGSRSGSNRRQKGRMVMTRYSEEEFAVLEEEASKAGLTLASYQRVQTLTTVPKTRSKHRAPVDRELLSKALGQLGRAGNNLNQIAHAANINGAERHDIMTTIADMRDLLPLFREALGRKA